MSFLTRNDRHIAYRHQPGASPGIVFLCGFNSDMTGTKAMALDAFCKERGMAYLRFDYRGHGESSGKFEEHTIGDWKDDALLVLDKLTEGPQILVGSSMGGWIMLLAALARPEKVKALVGIASAPDFTETLLWKQLSEAKQREMQTQGMIYVPSCSDQDQPYPITMKLVEEGRKHLLLSSYSTPPAGGGIQGGEENYLDHSHLTSPASGGGNKIPIHCPVHLLHGMSDEDVPHTVSLTLAERLESEDVHVTLVKNAGHRFSEPVEIGVMLETVGKLL